GPLQLHQLQTPAALAQLATLVAGRLAALAARAHLPPPHPVAALAQADPAARAPSRPPLSHRMPGLGRLAGRPRRACPALRRRQGPRADRAGRCSRARTARRPRPFDSTPARPRATGPNETPTPTSGAADRADR